MLVAGVHSAGVDLDAAVQVRWLRDADRMEIQKCDRLTYILTRVGARDGCASRCGPVHYGSINSIRDLKYLKM